MTRILALLFLLCGTLDAATYYVRKDGSDSNSGLGDTATSAWLTIGKAASIVAPGDTVHVRAGTYAEYVTLSTAGADGNPIRWYGERSGESWLTIVDPSISAGSGWVVAPEKGAGVYKHTSLPWRPGALIAGEKLVAEYRDAGRGAYDATASWLTPASSPIAASSTAIRTSGTGMSGEWWDGIEGFWVWSSGTAYIRFRDSSDPNTKSIRISYNGGLATDSGIDRAPMLLTTASHNVIQDFEIRRAFVPVVLKPPTGATLTGVVLKSNYVHTGFFSVLAGSFGTSHGTITSNAIVQNVLQMNWYAGDTSGPWNTSVSSSWTAFNTYEWGKYWVSTSDLEPPAIALGNVTTSNLISGNVVTNSHNGICTYQTTRQAHNWTISSNRFARCQEAIQLKFGDGIGTVWIHDNEFEQSHMMLRPHSINRDNGNAEQTRYYVYRNRGWNPSNLGAFIYAHMDSAGTYSTLGYWYHNSYEGGSAALTMGTAAADRISGWNFWNNIFAAASISYDSQLRSTSDIGLFHHNLVLQAKGWMDSPNVVQSTYPWGGSSPSTSMPTFWINTNSAAWEGGTNLAGLSLPDNRSVEFDSPDIGWYELPDGGEQTPPVFLTAVTSQIFEGGASGTVRITRSTTSLGSPLSGTWTVGGTAVDGVHYASVSGNWTIDAGQSYEDVTVTPLTDGVRTGDLAITFTLNTGAGYTVAGGPVTVYYRDSTPDTSIPRNPPLPGSFRPPRP